MTWPPCHDVIMRGGSCAVAPKDLAATVSGPVTLRCACGSCTRRVWRMAAAGTRLFARMAREAALTMTVVHGSGRRPALRVTWWAGQPIGLGG